MIILRKWYRIYQYRLTTKRCVMKKILIIVIWLLSMCCAFFAGDRIKMYEIIQSSILEMTAKSDDHYLDGKRCQKRWFR